MQKISILEIQRDPLACLQRVEAGETLVVLRDERPVAEIKPISVLPAERRPFGMCAGEFSVPDGFDEPLPEPILKDFED